MNFCSHCGHRVDYRIPEGDTYHRHVCPSCQRIHYQNPRVIVGCVPIWEDRILLCRRAIEPCKGLWNLPGGFLENGETAEAGAARELWEEALVRSERLRLHAVYSVPQANQVYIHYLAHMDSPSFGLTSESSEIQLFDENNVPWEDIAFSSSLFSLRHYFADRAAGCQRIHHGAKD